MPLADALLLGHNETVGVRYFKGQRGNCPPLRVFYPAEKERRQEQHLRWFHDHGVGFYVSGYLHVLGIKQHTWQHRMLSSILGGFSSLLSNLSRIWTLPSGISLDAPPIKPMKAKHPVIVFSHGLTGSGHEHSILYAAWAKKGFVVVSVQHTDGSSCRVRLGKQEDLYYRHGPPYSKYDPTFRPKQVQHRAKEFREALDFFHSDDRLHDIRCLCKGQRAIAAGFSYGAATAALAVVEHSAFFQGLILLDGWFYIEVSKSAGVEFEFPKPVFKDEHRVLNEVPSIFINSEQVQGHQKLYRATCKLAQETKLRDNMHVLAGTKHNNMCDLVFWFPSFLLRKFSVIGSADPSKSYEDIIKLTTDFLCQNFSSS